MEDIIEIVKNTLHSKFIQSIIIIIVSIFIYKFLTGFIIKSEKNKTINQKLNNRSKTYLKLTTNIIRYIFIILTILTLLQTNGIDVSSMLAGVGIASVILGLAIQDALKDIIKGIDILSDNYYQVGDIIKFQDITGRVLAIGLKTTKLEDIYSLNKVSLANRNIEKVEVVSNLINIDIPLPYEMKVVDAEKVIEEISKNVFTLPFIKFIVISLSKKFPRARQAYNLTGNLRSFSIKLHKILIIS